MLNHDDYLKGKHLYDCFRAELWVPFPWNTIFSWMNDEQTMIIHIWVSGRHFLKNKQHEPVTSRETTNSTVVNEKIELSSGKSNIGIIPVDNFIKALSEKHIKPCNIKLSDALFSEIVMATRASISYSDDDLIEIGLA